MSAHESPSASAAFTFFAAVSLALILALFFGIAFAARGIAALEQDNARLREACGVKDGAL